MSVEVLTVKHQLSKRSFQNEIPTVKKLYSEIENTQYSKYIIYSSAKINKWILEQSVELGLEINENKTEIYDMDQKRRY